MAKEAEVTKTYAEINARIKKGEAVVVTAEEMIDIVNKEGAVGAAKRVDVVTTGTYGPMCSSGAFLNFGHSKPKMKVQKAWLNGVSAYAGLAAVDLYIGVTEIPDDDPANKVYPGKFLYGGGHVIEDLIAGRDVRMKALSYGTDCYPRKELESMINLEGLNECYLFNPRNAYQNYNCAVNLSSKMIYTYMGGLKPKAGNANYCSAGQLSPLLNDPYYRTIGLGTRIFIGGGVGYVVAPGTQHNPTVKRGENGVVRAPAGTLATYGDLRGMNTRYIKGVSIQGYGSTLALGIGVPIPVLNEEIARSTGVSDEQIVTQIVDYGIDYPEGVSKSYGEVNYKELKSGKITIDGKEVKTASLSSYPMAVEIAETLKEWILKGEFLLGEPQELLPSADSGISFKPLKERI
ncbi:MAG: hypothetical protein GXP58_00235 [Deltaproteobacteria bacterium]|nr:hypothetical protein [Deltaproteobacteria bacterium]